MAKKIEMQGSGAKPAGASSTQGHLKVGEIKAGTIVMRDGTLRAVMVVSSTNFSLKSTDEQNALIASYQSFINSLDFPIQILMQSRKLDINAYLEKLRGILEQQTNELLKLQTQEYIEYVTKLVEFASIMNKTFYVIVPYSIGATKEGFVAQIKKLFNPASMITLEEHEFEEHREVLYNRVEHVASALNGMGLRTITLSTEELVELLYNSYNLSSASAVRIKSVEELDLARLEQ